jgi:hypothetical protein
MEGTAHEATNDDDFGQIYLPAESVRETNPLLIDYSFQYFGGMLERPGVVGIPQSADEAKYNSSAAWVLGCYYTAAYLGKFACGRTDPIHVWVDALWEARNRFGEEYVNSLLYYSVRLWRDRPPAYTDSFDRFFRAKISVGESVKDSSPSRYRELDLIFQEHGIVTSPPIVVSPS